MCFSCTPYKWLDRRVSLWRMDKIPYGTKYTHENLSSIFPSAEIQTTNRFPILFQSGNDSDISRAIIIIGPEFKPEPGEMTSIIRFAASGKNQVFISVLNFGDTVMNMLHLKLAHNLMDVNDSTDVSILDPVQKEWIKYTYPGYTNNSFFESIDTGHTKILGKDDAGRPDFIRISYAHGGAIFIHLSPFMFSNFFLLHNNNKSYYDIALSYLPKQTTIVEWSDYFRYNKRDQRFSIFRFIFSQRSLRWAFWLTVILFLIMFLVETKRKQRPMTDLPVTRNASEDFVKTVGRLYFQQKNNQNLGIKMVAAFLENVRSTYNLSTSVLDEDFAHKLAIRSGRPIEQIKIVIHSIHDTRLNSVLSDQELMDLHHQISQFNKPV
jgi:hypothetical protein